MDEAEKPLIDYLSIEDVFTRSLKSGSRTNSDSFLVSPADGKISQLGSAHDEQAIQIKGLNYDLRELVYSRSASPKAEAKLVWFSTVYLAPHNYHRVHSPVSGTVLKTRYVPGNLWPVNKPFVKHMPQLFLKNERLVFDIQVENGGVVYVVMVGALNVGRINTALMPDFTTNSLEKLEEFETDINKPIRKGDCLGVFMLGSTVVTVFDENASKCCELPMRHSGEREVLVGESLLT